MSLSCSNQRLRIAGFPRVSGDEPGAANAALAGESFSPRERG